MLQDGVILTFADRACRRHPILHVVKLSRLEEEFADTVSYARDAAELAEGHPVASVE